MTGRFLIAVVAASACAGVLAESVTDSVPQRPDPGARYLLYLHGLAVEDRGPNARTPDGVSDYHGVVKALAETGFHVISELRSPGTVPSSYARKTAGQVRSLLAAGVPARNIVVAGFSKGGMITLMTAAEVAEPEVRYVVLAGCGAGRTARGYREILDSYAGRMKGRILSLYDRGDAVAGSCREAFERAGPALKSEEKVFDDGRGHGLFFQPGKLWIDPLAEWAMR